MNTYLHRNGKVKNQHRIVNNYLEKRRNRGSFTFEAVVVVGLISTMLFFVTDISKLLMTKMQAERLSYSLVNALKERRLFESNTSGVSDSLLIKQVGEALAPDLNFGIVVANTNPNADVTFNSFSTCDNQPSSEHELRNMLEALIPITKTDSSVAVYYVGVCISDVTLSGYILPIDAMTIYASSILPSRDI